MKRIDVDVVLQESGEERIPLFVTKNRRKHKMLNPHVIIRKQLYIEKKAIVYQVQVGGDTCKLFLHMEDITFWGADEILD